MIHYLGVYTTRIPGMANNGRPKATMHGKARVTQTVTPPIFLLFQNDSRYMDVCKACDAERGLKRTVQPYSNFTCPVEKTPTSTSSMLCINVRTFWGLCCRSVFLAPCILFMIDVRRGQCNGSFILRAVVRRRDKKRQEEILFYLNMFDPFY